MFSVFCISWHVRRSGPNKQSLIAFADSPEYFSKSMLQTRLEKLGIVSEGSQILDALKMLSDMGYDIVRKEKGTVYYSLGKRAYDDEMLQKFLTKCQKIYYDITDEDRALFLKAMLRKHKITRPNCYPGISVFIVLIWILIWIVKQSMRS